MRQLVAGKHLAKFVSFVPKFPHFSHEDGSGGDVDDDNEGRRREGPPPLSLSVASGDRMHSEKGLQGSANPQTPGSVKMRCKSCVLLPAAGRRTQLFPSYSRNLGFVDLPIPVQGSAKRLALGCT